MSERLKIAVVGAGISGITAAYYLAKTHQVTLIEKNSYLGGHTNTFIVREGPDRGLAIDTGFIVCNPVNYPNFYRLLTAWGVDLRNSEMSFGYTCESERLSYIGPRTEEILRTPINLFRPQFVKMLWERRRFGTCAIDDLATGALHGLTIGEYVQGLGLSDYFLEHYLVPLSASIWSSPDRAMLGFPAETFVTFFRNHGMLSMKYIPQWQTVVGGSYRYVEAFRKLFQGEIRLNSAVTTVRRGADKTQLSLIGGECLEFDVVVLGVHSDDVPRLVVDLDDSERGAFSRCRYQPNQIVLHRDDSVLPRNRSLWASWNYIRKANHLSEIPVQITYYMNRLQGLNAKHNYFVTLNQTEKIAEESVLYRNEYAHPVFDLELLNAQQRIKDLNGHRRTYYCGAYLRYGFHEDGVVSGLAVAEAIGGS